MSQSTYSGYEYGIQYEDGHVARVPGLFKDAAKAWMISKEFRFLLASPPEGIVRRYALGDEWEAFSVPAEDLHYALQDEL